MFRDGNYGLSMQWVCDSFTGMSGKGMLVKYHVRVSQDWHKTDVPQPWYS